MLCCPEDVRHCGGEHGPEVLCGKCKVPMCATCVHTMLRPGRAVQIPMALCNDNFWGYSSPILNKYQVRWIEMAAVLPCWTSMIVYYVEGDYGDLMTEKVGKQRHRTAVRGHCYSFIMPWEDILDDLGRHALRASHLQANPIARGRCPKVHSHGSGSVLDGVQTWVENERSSVAVDGSALQCKCVLPRKYTSHLWALRFSINIVVARCLCVGRQERTSLMT